MGIWIEDDDKVFTVKDLYNEAQDNNEPLLSIYNGSWWAPYITNHDHFDRLFKKKYSSWFPYDQDYTDGVDSVLDEFQADVYALLLANDKKYTELYRVNVIADNDAYSLVNNLDVTETTNRTVDTDNTFTKGEETVTDEGTNEYGQQLVNVDTSNQYGQQLVEVDTSNQYGQQLVEVDGEDATGQQTTTTTNQTAPFNTSDWNNTDRSDVNAGARTDTTNLDTTYGAHTDTLGTDTTYGSHTDTLGTDTTYGTHTDSIDNTRTLSTREDTNNTDVEEEVTTHRVGNQGVSTVDDILRGHVENWTNPLFSFYDVVFSDIAAELLRGC